MQVKKEEVKSENIEFIRGIAVIGVVAHHTKAVSNFNVPFLGDYGGLLGVELFFLLSGYLITESAIRNNLRNFLINRFFRIFPAYWVAYLLMGLYAGIFFKKDYDYFALLLNFLNLQQLTPKSLIFYDALHVSWTLTVELFWYLIAPLFVLGKKRGAIFWIILSIIISSSWSYLSAKGIIYPYYAESFSKLHPPADLGQVGIIINNNFLGQFVFFIFGGSIFFYREYLFKISDVVLNILIVFFILLIGLYQSNLPSPFFVTAIGLSALMIKIMKSNFSRDKLVCHIGKISYSVYLIHFPIIIFFVRHLHQKIGVFSIFAAYMTIIVLSNLMFNYIEKPFVKIGRSLNK